MFNIKTYIDKFYRVYFAFSPDYFYIHLIFDILVKYYIKKQLPFQDTIQKECSLLFIKFKVKCLRNFNIYNRQRNNELTFWFHSSTISKLSKPSISRLGNFRIHLDHFPICFPGE